MSCSSRKQGILFKLARITFCVIQRPDEDPQCMILYVMIIRIRACRSMKTSGWDSAVLESLPLFPQLNSWMMILCRVYNKHIFFRHIEDMLETKWYMCQSMLGGVDNYPCDQNSQILVEPPASLTTNLYVFIVLQVNLLLDPLPLSTNL